MVFAVNIFGFNISSWEGWIPLGVGLGAGVISVMALTIASRRKNRRAAKKEDTGAPDSDPFIQGSASEQRRALRRAGNPIKVFLATPGEESPQGSAWVLDRSIGGLCLSVNQEYETGSMLRVLPSTAPDLAYWIDVEVRSCRTIKGGFEVGVQFVKTPPWSILLLFG